MKDLRFKDHRHLWLVGLDTLIIRYEDPVGISCGKKQNLVEASCSHLGVARIQSLKEPQYIPGTTHILSTSRWLELDYRHEPSGLLLNPTAT